MRFSKAHLYIRGVGYSLLEREKLHDYLLILDFFASFDLSFVSNLNSITQHDGQQLLVNSTQSADHFRHSTKAFSPLAVVS